MQAHAQEDGAVIGLVARGHLHDLLQFDGSRQRFDGGAELVGSSSPQVVPEPKSDPSAVDPEEAFVASLSSCHTLWFV
jgi:organic hydroperoxide reductase OsmC/OhrA